MLSLKKVLLQCANFLAHYHYYLVAYILSSFLAPFVGVENVGYVFIVSSILVALILYAAPPIFRSFGTRNVLAVLTILEIGVLLGLAVSTTWALAVILITLQTSLTFALFIGMDFLIEASTSEEKVTGTTRTAYLVFTNVAVLLGALSISFVVVGDQFWRAFVTSALVLIPFLVLAVWFLPCLSFPEKNIANGSVVETLKNNPSLLRITLAYLLLQVFFSWMSIYMPILLFVYEGLPWSDIGIIFAIAMLAYIVLEFPLGWLADNWIGEKEILVTGFFIVGISLSVIALMSGVSFWWWVGIMLFSRVGAAMIEAMTEVHFFRSVSEKDTGTITFFRVLRPIGSIIGPVIASIALLVLPLSSAFLVFGAVMLLGIPVALGIVDSK